MEQKFDFHKETGMNHVIDQLKLMKGAQVDLAAASTPLKNKILSDLSNAMVQSTAEILQANADDLEKYRQTEGFQKAFMDRLKLDEARIQSMATSLNEVASLPDPVGTVLEDRVLPNHLRVQKVRSPLGVLFLIFEARPNVIIEAFGLALKSGNALILKGGKESDGTSAVIYRLVRQVLKQNKMSENLFWGLTGAPREMTDFLIKQNKYIDVLIPRGGDRLIEYVTEHARIPLIKNDRGLCHLYVHGEADPTMALSILLNAKTQRPSVCNAIETLLVDRSIAPAFLPLAQEALKAKGVKIFACPQALKIMAEALIGSGNIEQGNIEQGEVVGAEASSFDREYLDLILNVKVVEDHQEARLHIAKHGSGHSESIVTANREVARRFQATIDAAVVYWNASTRFTDGGQLGLGAEIGISTQKLHVRGPVGLDSLTSARWIIDGEGQVRS